ncbi:hypothetical protein R1flu_019981 [Riccia fluitans]|uniref:Methyltransferase-like protein 13 n=1 Tax=Riccia fluitans TaxID=41844 RepID=A0ABD1ZK71_9MARC
MSESNRTDSRDFKPPEGDREGQLTNEFEEIKAGRRTSLEFPLSNSVSVTAVVLDSTRAASGQTTDCRCAALIVPRQREKEWVYSTEGGQWQLLVSAGVSRLIILFRRRDSVKQAKQYQRRVNISDEALETILRPLVLALTPKILFCGGIPKIPFLNYSDSVIQRVEKEVAYSSLTGFMMVEDVELKPELEEGSRSSCVSRISSQFPGGEHESIELVTSSSKSSSTWKRRLIFQRMPNLIQTEAALMIHPQPGSKPCGRERKAEGSSSKRKEKGFPQTRQGLERVVDHSRLVHKYLPPIVAGFVLISPVLDSSIRSRQKAKVFCIGVGGGALPTFLHHQFDFHIKVIDVDGVVLDLARRHFGLKEGSSLEVTAGDGLDAVAEIAAIAISAGLVHEDLVTNWKRSSNGDLKPYVKLPTSTSQAADVEDTVKTLEENLSSGENLSSRVEAGKSVCDGLMDSELGGELKFTDENAQGAARGSKLDSEFQSIQVEQRDMDPRYEIIIVDVDASDARSELSAPPVAFLGRKFLLSALIALKEHGMLVMNVISSGAEAYEEVIEALGAIFEEVYEIMLDDEIYHSVVFALVKPSAYNRSLASPAVELVRSVIDNELIHWIRKVKFKHASST